MLAHSLQIESRKSLAHDMIDTCAKHAGIVHDMEDKTARNKTAAITAMFSQLSNVNFF